VVLTQSDMDPSNFGVAHDGRAVIFDVATIQALPDTLAKFTLFKTTNFARRVAAYMFSPAYKDALVASSNFAALAAVRQHLTMGDDDLGKVNLACFLLGAEPPFPLFLPLGVDANGIVTPRRRTASKCTSAYTSPAIIYLDGGSPLSKKGCTDRRVISTTTHIATPSMPTNAATTSKSNAPSCDNPKPTLNSIYATCGGWYNFLLSYGLKPWNPDDVEEGKRIAEAMLEYALKDWEESMKG